MPDRWARRISSPEALVQVAVVEEARQRVAVGEGPRRLVELRVAEGHGGLVRHRPDQVQAARLEVKGPEEAELHEPDRLALGDEGDHHHGPLAEAAQERDLGRVGCRVERVDHRGRLGHEDAPGLGEAGQLEDRLQVPHLLRRPVALRQEAVAGSIPGGDPAFVGLEGAADVLGDQIRHLPRVQAPRERAAHVGDPPEVLGQGHRGADRARGFDRGGRLVRQGGEDTHVGEVELAEPQFGEGDDARDPVLVAHGDDDHRLLDFVRPRDRHPSRVSVGIRDEERSPVRGDPAGEPLADLDLEVRERDRLVALVARSHDRDEVVGLLEEVDPAGVVVDDRPDLFRDHLGDGTD